MLSFAYHRPKTLQEAWKLSQSTEGARYVAGATDLMVQVRKHGLRPAAVISLRAVPDIGGIDVGASIRIGARTTIAEIVRSKELHEAIPVLAEAARALGSAQIRNVATIGGNLCNASPCADTATPLLVLEAQAELIGPEGTRRLPMSEFFLAPGRSARRPHEILAALWIDKPSPSAGSTFLKKRRVRMDLALASVSVLLELKGSQCNKARIAAGSVAPVPLRLREVESLLEGKTLTADLLSQARMLAAKGVMPITDLRTTAEYRRHIVGVYVKRACESLLARKGGAA